MMNFCIDAKLLKAIAMGAASPKDARQSLKFVSIDSHGIAATDSYRLHYAEILTDGAPDDAILLDAETLAKLKAPKHGNITFEEIGGGRWIVNGGTLMEASDCRYPNWRQFVNYNTTEPVERIAFGVDLLESVTKAFKVFGKGVNMVFDMNGSNRPATIKTSDEDNPLRVLLMPVHLPESL